MHDCRKFKDRLIDLLFESAGEDERSRALQELNGCGLCQNLYRSMSESLAIFDKVAETALPEEDYWPGYEERLRARLSEPLSGEPARARQSAVAALFERISPRCFPLAVRAAAVASLIVAAALLLIFYQLKTTPQRAPAVVNNDGPAVEQKEFAYKQQQPETGELKSIPKIARRPPRATNRAAREPEPDIAKPDIAEPDIAPNPARKAAATERRAAGAGYLGFEVAGHLEQAELLMRAFRNIRPPEESASVDVSYEKQLSKELLAKNRRLRRSAENRRGLAIENLLSGIEPLLLDIANLPDSPTKDDVRSIKELIQRQEVVAALQFYSANASNRNY